MANLVNNIILKTLSEPFKYLQVHGFEDKNTILKYW